MKLSKIGEVLSSANRLLSDFIGLLSSKNFATMAKWRNDFSSLWSVNSLFIFGLFYLLWSAFENAPWKVAL